MLCFSSGRCRFPHHHHLQPHRQRNCGPLKVRTQEKMVGCSNIAEAEEGANIAHPARLFSPAEQNPRLPRTAQTPPEYEYVAQFSIRSVFTRGTQYIFFNQTLFFYFTKRIDLFLNNSVKIYFYHISHERRSDTSPANIENFIAAAKSDIPNISEDILKFSYLNSHMFAANNPYKVPSFNRKHEETFADRSFTLVKSTSLNILAPALQDTTERRTTTNKALARTFTVLK